MWLFKGNPYLFELLSPVTLTSEIMDEDFRGIRKMLRLPSDFCSPPRSIPAWFLPGCSSVAAHLQESHETRRLSSLLLLRLLACHELAVKPARVLRLVSVSTQPLLVVWRTDGWATEGDSSYLVAGYAPRMVSHLMPVHPVLKPMPTTVPHTKCFSFFLPK